MVKVYTKTQCPSCLQTKRFLDAMGVEYEVRNIEEDDSNFQEVLDLGYQQVPVVVTGGQWNDSWSGHQPAKLLKLK